jgi:hypothetical protein
MFEKNNLLRPHPPPLSYFQTLLFSFFGMFWVIWKVMGAPAKNLQNFSTMEKTKQCPKIINFKS